MINFENIKITRISKKKVQFDYEVPVVMPDINNPGKYIKGESIKISIRYAKDETSTFDGKKRRPLYENRYYTIGGIGLAIESIAFRNKIGNLSQYDFSSIVSTSQKNVTIGGVTYDKVVESYIVNDLKYLSIVRDKRLEEILK